MHYTVYAPAYAMKNAVIVDYNTDLWGHLFPLYITCMSRSMVLCHFWI